VFGSKELAEREVKKLNELFKLRRLYGCHNPEQLLKKRG
jgi:hypothetical protein